MRSWCLLVQWSLPLIAAQSLGAMAAAQQHSETHAEDASDDETLLSFVGGATINSGNTRSIAGNLGARLSIKRARHLFSANTQMNIGYAALRDPMTGDFGDYEPNARNFGGRLRYDFFLTDDDALFLAFVARNDTFAGIDSRLQTQLGYMRNIFRTDEDAQRLWAEAGYDLTVENYHPDPLLDDMGMVLDGDAVIHSLRLFVGYDNHITETFTALTGLEMLMDVQDVENTRLSWATELLAKISGAFQMGVSFTLVFDNQPVQGFDKVDTVTTLNLLYTLDLAPEEEEEVAEEEEPECPPCEECPVCEEPESEQSPPPDDEVGAPAQEPEAAEAPGDAPDGEVPAGDAAP